MKARIEFNLDNIDDNRSHQRCIKAKDMALILWEIQYNSKKSLEKSQENGLDPIDEFFTWFNDEMTERGINIDKLII